MRLGRIETRHHSSRQDTGKISDPPGALEHGDDAVDARGIVELPGQREDLAPHGTLPDRESATAEPALLEAPLPQVTDLTRSEDAINFAQDVREHGAAASAGPGDVEDDRGHE